MSEELLPCPFTRLVTDFVPECEGFQEGWRIHDFPDNDPFATFICDGLEEAEAKFIVHAVNSYITTHPKEGQP